MDSFSPMHPLIEVPQSEGVTAEYSWKTKRDTRVVAFMFYYYNAFDIPSVRAKVSHGDKTFRKTSVKCFKWLNLD